MNLLGQSMQCKTQSANYSRDKISILFSPSSVNSQNQIFHAPLFFMQNCAHTIPPLTHQHGSVKAHRCTKLDTRL